VDRSSAEILARSRARVLVAATDFAGADHLGISGPVLGTGAGMMSPAHLARHPQLGIVRGKAL
jgi:hypothetical protein